MMKFIGKMHVAAWAVCAWSAAGWASAAPTQVVVFGDSLSDTGAAAERFATIGVSLPAAPYAQGRFSNGPVAVEVLADQLGVSLDSRAVGGALTGTDNRITTGGVLAGTGVQGQIQAYIAEQSGALDTEALYVVWAGGNDFFGSPTVSTLVTAVFNLQQGVSQLYAAGARQFLVPNLPNLADTYDSIVAGAAVQVGAQSLTVGFNNALVGGMGSLQSTLAGSSIQVFDVFTLLATVRTDLANAGGVVDTPCFAGNYVTGGVACATPDAYYLWDSVHPTAYVHDTVGRAMAAAVPEPSTYALMGLGLVGVAAAARRRSAQAQAQA